MGNLGATLRGRPLRRKSGAIRGASHHRRGLNPWRAEQDRRRGQAGRPVGLLWAEEEKFEVEDRWSRLGMARRAALMNSKGRRRFRRQVNRSSRGPLKRGITYMRTRAKESAKVLTGFGARVEETGRAFCAGRAQGDIVAVNSTGGTDLSHHGGEWLPPASHRPNSNQVPRGARFCLTLLLVVCVALVLGLGREALAQTLVGVSSVGKNEAVELADIVDAKARGVLHVGVCYLLYNMGVGVMEEGVLKTITACAFWLTTIVVSARRWVLRDAGAKEVIVERSPPDSKEEGEEGKEEEKRKESTSWGNPGSREVNRPRMDVARRSTKASSEVGRLRCRAAVWMQSKVFGLYLYD